VNLKSIDLNLLVYLDVLLHKKSVTRSAEALGISQPAMSNSLQRLRKLFGDPLLVRTRTGMQPTERAESLKPAIRGIIAAVEEAVEADKGFEPATSDRLFRLAISDYAESTMLPHMLRRMRSEAPNASLDLLTPSDISFEDVEHGNVDMVINRFEELPSSFHSKVLWRDSFSCLLSRSNPIRENFTLQTYLQADHVWVSKTGMGVGVGVQPGDREQLGWVDNALSKLGKSRRIRVFTRHYQVATHLAEMRDLIVTLPTRAANLMNDVPGVVKLPPPFEIPQIELKMAWSPLLQNNPAHQWFRSLITDVTRHVI
jgi:DNA-binding transcriptional LysR family regulator